MDENALLERLKSIKYPGFSRDIVSFGLVKAIEIDSSRCQVRLAILSENEDLVKTIVSDVEALLASIDGLPPADVVVERPQIDRTAQAREMAQAMGGGPRPIPGVTRSIAVASAKGGVGKSTVAANLAVGLAQAGFRVGLLDADIYGPSVPTMFGVGKSDIHSDDDGKLVPVERHGVKLVSMGFFVADGAPLIWRGPMLAKALGQFLGDVAWGELDYLILDLPPGTGDVQMTLTQNVALDGGVIVTTPQDVALIDVERGIKMFQQASCPVLGIVENMSFHVCGGCGARTTPFGDGGGLKMASSSGIPFLGGVPLLRAVREAGDLGAPAIAADPEGEVGRIFAEIATQLSREVPLTEVGHA